MPRVQAFVISALSVQAFVMDPYGGQVSFYAGKALRFANWGNATNNPAQAVTGGFRDATGTLYDPVTVTLKYLLPGGTKVTVNTAGLVKDGVGLYHLNVTPTMDGTGEVTWTSSDGHYADPVTFKVEPARL